MFRYDLVLSGVLLAYCANFVTGADLPERLVGGYADIVELKGGAKEFSILQKEFMSYHGRDRSFMVEAGSAAQEVVWKTSKVPVDAREGMVTFVFGATFRNVKAKTEFRLSAGDRALMKFGTPVNGDTTWKEGDVVLRFDYIYDLWECASGVMYLSVPASSLRAGEPVQFTVRAAGDNSKVCFYLAAATDVQADPASRPAYNPDIIAPLKPVDADRLQYDGAGPFQMFERPTKNQGLDLLLGRGRVGPESSYDAATGTTYPSGRTIFRDKYTGAEVWRITNFNKGVARHAYSSMPAWNANGRLLMLQSPRCFIDQESCTLNVPRRAPSGHWVGSDPGLLVHPDVWEKRSCVVVDDIAQNKILRPIAPIREGKYVGVAPASADGSLAAFREGTQDEATTFGVASIDGSSYKSISLNGGAITSQSPLTFAQPGPQPGVEDTKGGVHALSFTRPDNLVCVGVNYYPKDAPRIAVERYFSADGTLKFTRVPMSHAASHPKGDFFIFEGWNGIWAMDPISNAKRRIVVPLADGIELHPTWTSYDPNWAAASWRTKQGGEILRVSMRPDASVARLCGSDPMNPQATSYNNDEFACLSPDGTKALFMSSMSGSMNEYVVVAANPRPPKLAAQWTDQGYQLNIQPDELSREIKQFRIFRAGKDGGQEVGIVPFRGPWERVGPVAPLAFVVKDAQRKEDSTYFVRAQEWSGLQSNRSNLVNSLGKPVHSHVEAESLNFQGFKQGFDPQGSGDMYHLFLPAYVKDGSVSVPATAADSYVWARVAGENVSLTVISGDKTIDIPQNSYQGWTWISLGKVAGEFAIRTTTPGLKIDRFLLASDPQTIPAGIGLDWQLDPSFQNLRVEDLKAASSGPFAVRLSWKPVAGARYYNVYASQTSEFVPAQSNLLYSPPAGTEFTLDWGLQAGSKWFYKVVAVSADGGVTRPGEANFATPAITVDTNTIEYERGILQGDAKTESDAGASAGKALLLDKGQAVSLEFTAAVDGEYVVWHSWRADNDKEVRLSVSLDDEKPFLMTENYDLCVLTGKAFSKEYEWSIWNGAKVSDFVPGVFKLKAGKHVIKITTEKPIRMDKIIVTNDHSFVPKGRLNTY